ncbi:group III truncated hemoglobin [Pseudorhodoplanes sinuspersici]|uniref:Preprotein translocase subunit TatC n=1 Tax=Pseudorhodoplanes sinuspersici TaxID=1235591 RepID=A0A1W6ZQA0_9HYPH|nr:group III truncated hemoglobin [Pseudorhodoplanes sinuspersici]ARP99588.1 preprotein translocase subunit TatC [Pseudorhodoplanes sinuspersici]RKE70560.1 hemoglobin [Pseudorhodoplanes sinuspersici]
MSDEFPVTAQAAAERRVKITAAIQAETGIDEAMIEKLVRGFYDRVRNDDLLGPVFASRISDWEPHLQQMFAFWSSVALMSGRYHGQPMRKHLRLPVDGRHFDRWLALFEQTARDLCPSKAADHFIERAHRIAESIELGVAGANGIMLRPGERLVRENLPEQ